MKKTMKKNAYAFLLSGLSMALLVTMPHGANAEAVVSQTKAGSLEISDAHMVYKKDSLDIYLTIKNTGKVDEQLGGFDTPIAHENLVEVVDKDGKDVQVLANETLPAGKEVEFSRGDKWLRIVGVKEPRETDIIPISLFFRRSPNANLKLALDTSEADKHPTAAPTASSPAPSAPTKEEAFAPKPKPVPAPAKPVVPGAPKAPAAPVPPSSSASTPSASAPETPASTTHHSWLDWFKK
ncbi:MAG: copper chaperone PCu(A)C [Alphaproteobacteria bacterium]|nr:copper chaperone PCu(A)C [Alphaproteobacteria bacterium]